MTGALNTGKGRCPGTARLLVQPVQAVIELGASGDVRTKLLNAVHHANRHGAEEDFIAVSLPSMRMGRNCALPGHDIELIGSEASLAALINLDGVQSLIRRGMLQELQVDEVEVTLDEIGAAYVRDRSCEKHTSGWLRRNKARAERRGKAWSEWSAQVKRNDLSTLALPYGSTVLHIRQILARMTDAPLMVSTYGFSSPGPDHQAVLPVYPDAAREAENAA